MLWLGWFFIALGVASYAVNWARQFADVGVLLASPALLFVGVFSIVMARNVREIRVDGDRIQFLPVGASLPLDEIIAIKKPAQSGAPTHIELSTKAARSRYVHKGRCHSPYKTGKIAWLTHCNCYCWQSIDETVHHCFGIAPPD